jgi:hypothetical protein
LVTAIFVSHVKILACVRLKGEHKNIKIKIPNMETFVHKIYILVCNKFYNKTDLIHESEEILIPMISHIINECIRKQLPIEHILQEYLFDVFNDDAIESEESVKSDKSDKEFTADEVADEYVEDDRSDAESEFENEQKAIPVIPIDGNPYHRDSPIPNFDDVTKIEVPESAINTPNLGPEQINTIDDIPRVPLENHMSHGERPISPVTLFDDAKEF